MSTSNGYNDDKSSQHSGSQQIPGSNGGELRHPIPLRRSNACFFTALELLESEQRRTNPDPKKYEPRQFLTIPTKEGFILKPVKQPGDKRADEIQAQLPKSFSDISTMSDVKRASTGEPPLKARRVSDLLGTDSPGEACRRELSPASSSRTTAEDQSQECQMPGLYNEATRRLSSGETSLSALLCQQARLGSPDLRDHSDEDSSVGGTESLGEEDSYSEDFEIRRNCYRSYGRGHHIYDSPGSSWIYSDESDQDSEFHDQEDDVDLDFMFRDTSEEDFVPEPNSYGDPSLGRR